MQTGEFPVDGSWDEYAASFGFTEEELRRNYYDEGWNERNSKHEENEEN